MDTASKNIFAGKKAALENEDFVGSATSRMKGKDIMSIMRQYILLTDITLLLMNETTSASQRIFF